jgi:hypothetical protein
MRIGLMLAFIVAAITAAGSYLWQEQRAVQNER